MHFYRPQRSCGKVMLLHLSVSHSVHRREGVSVPACTTGHMTWGSLFGWVSVQGVSVQGVSVWGGVSVQGVPVRGVSVQGGLCLMVSVQGVSVRETPQTETPLYGNERVLHILLECILFTHTSTRSPT